MNYKTQGVVIRRHDFSEADRILTIFTERFGKIKAIAKGVKKIKAKLAGSLEPFMVIDLELHEGKTFYIATGATIINDYPQLHSDLEKMATVLCMGELIDKFEKEEQKSEKVFKLLVEALDALNTVEETKNTLLLRAFEIRLLHLAGYLADMTECLHCKAKIAPGNNNWDGEEGGIICANCQSELHHGRAISDNLIKFFRLAESGDFNVVGRLNLPKELCGEAEVFLSSYIRDVLESDLRSDHFLKNLH